MPIYHFNLDDGKTTLIDEEGQWFETEDDVMRAATAAARDLLATEVRMGVINLAQTILVTDQADRSILELNFSDAVEVLNPPESRRVTLASAAPAADR